MRRSTLWMFLIAFLTAGMAVWMAYKWIRLQAPHPGPGVAKGPETTQVVIATSKISFAQKIDKNQIETVAWPVGRVPEGAFSKKEDVEGKIAKQTIIPNEPVLRDHIVAMDQLKGSILAAFITPNMRAVSVRVNDVTDVGGFVLPGNRVDVIESVKGKGSRILLENLKVLAVDQEADKDKPAVVKAVTLEVTPEQAETLVGATQDSSIHLALRNPQDDRRKTEKQRRTLTVVRGDKVNIYKVNAYEAQ